MAALPVNNQLEFVLLSCGCYFLRLRLAKQWMGSAWYYAFSWKVRQRPTSFRFLCYLGFLTFFKCFRLYTLTKQRSSSKISQKKNVREKLYLTPELFIRLDDVFVANVPTFCRRNDTWMFNQSFTWSSNFSGNVKDLLRDCCLDVHGYVSIECVEPDLARSYFARSSHLKQNRDHY